VSAPFIAETAQGRVRGVAAFVEHQGRVYQLLGYSGSSYYRAAAPVLTAAIGSFGPVTDPAVLGVQPKRMDVVRLQQAQSLSQFADRFPSAVPVEQLAILNHVPDGSTPLPAGTLVKRVTT
jgi:predicted Zn-dependent protease